MDAVVRRFSYCLDYLRHQVTDLSDLEMVQQPDGIMNHPAWTIGHLTISCQAIGGEIGIPRWLPESWGQRFGMGSVPVCNTENYDTKNQSLLILQDAQARITQAVSDLDESQLRQPMPDQRYHEFLPTVHDAIIQILVAHTSYHVGQVAIWRRKMNLSPVERCFL